MLSFNYFNKYIVQVNLMNKLNTYHYRYANLIKSVFLLLNELTLNHIRIKYSLLPKMNTFISYYKSKLYFYHFLKSKVNYNNETSNYRIYNSYIMFSNDCYETHFFFEWFFFYYYNNYKEKSYIEFYNSSVVKPFRVKFQSIDNAYRSSLYRYIDTLRFIMIYIFFEMNSTNASISKLWLSHTFLSII